MSAEWALSAMAAATIEGLDIAAEDCYHISGLDVFFENKTIGQIDSNFQAKRFRKCLVMSIVTILRERLLRQCVRTIVILVSEQGSKYTPENLFLKFELIKLSLLTASSSVVERRM